MDLSASVNIPAEPTDVAGVLFDPHRLPEWVSAVESVEVLDKAIRPGARVRHTGALFGRPITWTTEVAGFHFPHVLDLRVVDGPFVGSLHYRVDRSPGGSRVTVRSVGSVDGAPDVLVAPLLQAALGADLERLRSLVVPAPPPAPLADG
ncbi:MAG TPA: SRPBCC family protein [Vicinamibacterales bacterium]|nr:SRPBCC family protein [Vicinamibacterales bacterium]